VYTCSYKPRPCFKLSQAVRYRWPIGRFLGSLRCQTDVILRRRVETHKERTMTYLSYSVLQGADSATQCWGYSITTSSYNCASTPFLLAALFSTHRQKLNCDLKCCVFLDRNGKTFRHLLDWLLRAPLLIPLFLCNKYQ